MRTDLLSNRISSLNRFLLLNFERLDRPLHIRIGLVIQEVLCNVRQLTVFLLMAATVSLVSIGLLLQLVHQAHFLSYFETTFNC